MRSETILTDLRQKVFNKKGLTNQPGGILLWGLAPFQIHVQKYRNGSSKARNARVMSTVDCLQQLSADLYPSHLVKADKLEVVICQNLKLLGYEE